MSAGKRGRSAINGRFITVRQAKAQPNTSVIERPKPKRSKK